MGVESRAKLIVLPYLLAFGFYTSKLFSSTELALLELLSGAIFGFLAAWLISRFRLRYIVQISYGVALTALFSLVLGPNTYYGVPTTSTFNSIFVSFRLMSTYYRNHHLGTLDRGSLIELVFIIALSAFASETARSRGYRTFSILADSMVLSVIAVALAPSNFNGIRLALLLAVMFATFIVCEIRPKSLFPSSFVTLSGQSGRKLSSKGLYGYRTKAKGVFGFVILVVVAVIPSVAMGPALTRLQITSSGFGGNNSQSGQLSLSVSMNSLYEFLASVPIKMFTVSTSAPSYFTLANLDYFDGTNWNATGISSRLPGPWLNQQGANKISQTYNIERLGGNALPVVDEAVSVTSHSSGTSLSLNPLGLLSISGGAFDNLGYQVASYEPALLGTTILQNPDFGVDPSLLSQYLELPNLPNEIHSIAQLVTKGDATPGSKAVALENYFQSGSFTYSLTPPTLSPGGEGLLQFLTATRTGFCQQYATAFAVLAREVGLPSRVVVGFDVGSPTSETNQYQILSTDAHAWPQVYFGSQVGWVSFEPTPSGFAGQSPTPLPGFIGPTPTTTPSATTTPNATTTPSSKPSTSTGSSLPTSTVKSPTTTKPIHANSGSSNKPNWAELVLIVLALLILIIGAYFAKEKSKKMHRMVSGDKRGSTSSKREKIDFSGVETAWNNVFTKFAIHGIQKRGSETFVEFSKRASLIEPVDPMLGNALFKLADLGEKEAYSSENCNPRENQDALALAEEIDRYFASLELSDQISE